MLGQHVTDFMANNSGQLVLVLGYSQQAGMHAHKTTGQGKGIGGRVFKQVDLPCLAAVQGRRQCVADTAHIADLGLIGRQRGLLFELAVGG